MSSSPNLSICLGYVLVDGRLIPKGEWIGQTSNDRQELDIKRTEFVQRSSLSSAIALKSGSFGDTRTVLNAGKTMWLSDDLAMNKDMLIHDDHG